MQAIPTNFVLDDQQAYLRQDTDTAHPRTPIPIYYIHDGDTPFCHNPRCFCQRGKRAGAMLYGEIAKGELLLAQLAAAMEKGEDAVSNTTETSQPTRTVVHVELIDGLPEECQLYGHGWRSSGDPGAKECALCGVRGYCPSCVSMPPPNARPFTCARHGHRQVRP